MKENQWLKTLRSAAVQNKNDWFVVFKLKAQVRSQATVIITHASDNAATCGCAEQSRAEQHIPVQQSDLRHADGKSEDGVSRVDSSLRLRHMNREDKLCTQDVSCNYMLRQFNIEYVWPVHHSVDGQDADLTGCCFGTTARMANSPLLTERTRVSPINIPSSGGW